MKNTMPNPSNEGFFKNLFVWLIVLFVLLSVVNSFGPHKGRSQEMSYSSFVKAVHDNEIAEVAIDGREVRGTTTANNPFVTYMPMEQDQLLLNDLIKQSVKIEGKKPDDHLLMRMFISWFPMILLFGIMFYLFRQMQGGGGRGGPMSFGRSRAKMFSDGQISVSFDDVAGIEEAKEEVQEVVEFLKDPTRFHKLGGKIPCGVLLVGPPGSGKTLLAKACAGEAKVDFFSISGSDFVEMFVGVGASRVRDMFEQAKKQAPCIIFIDELDAVGRHRGAGLGGGHDEREQTLNQMLVEMDGFEGKENIIVMAATNRPDVLDPALLRPGRFDRQVVVPLPDVRGREHILEVHMKKVPLAKDVNVKRLARSTPGFSGAQLANLVNEAALFAAKGNKKLVGMLDMEKAKDKIMMGAERRSMVMKDEEKEQTAYHEAGHAIVGLQSPDHDPVYKVTIIPRGRALGVTMFVPDEDRYSYSFRRLESQLASLFGGRIAEKIIYGEENVTTGASNDIERATEIARNMVTKWGFSGKLGPLCYGEEEGEVFLGRSVTSRKEVSDTTAHMIDEEVKAIIDRNYARAEAILNAHMPILHNMAEALMQYETIDTDQIDELMQGKKASPPSDWDDNSTSSSDSTPPPSAKQEVDEDLDGLGDPA